MLLDGRSHGSRSRGASKETEMTILLHSRDGRDRAIAVPSADAHTYACIHAISQASPSSVELAWVSFNCQMLLKLQLRIQS